MHEGGSSRTTLGAEDDLKIVTTLCNFVEFFCTVLQFNLSSEFPGIPKNQKCEMAAAYTPENHRELVTAVGGGLVPSN